jgi:general secretion pathway protein I
VSNADSRLTSHESLRERGFTLIEVLVALVVVALGMLGAIEAVNQSITTSTYLRDKAMAQWVAMNKLTEARLQTAVPQVDKTSGDAEMAGQKYRWTLVVTKTPVPTMLRLDVTISPPDSDDDKISLASATGFYSTSIGRQSQALACQDSINGPGGGGGPQTGNPQTGNPNTGNPGTQNPQNPPQLPPSPNKEPE